MVLELTLSVDQTVDMGPKYFHALCKAILTIFVGNLSLLNCILIFSKTLFFSELLI